MDFVFRRLYMLTLFPFQKGSKVNLSDFDKYWSIAISSLLGKHSRLYHYCEAI